MVGLDVHTGIGLPEADAIVLGVRQGSDGPALATTGIPDVLRDAVAAILTPLALTGAEGEFARIPSPVAEADAPPIILLTGLGREAHPNGDTEMLRRGAGRALAGAAGLPRVLVALPAVDDSGLAAIAEGALLGTYRFERHRRRSLATMDPPASVTVLPPGFPSGRSEGTHDAIVARALIVTEAVSAVRDLVNTSPLDLFPASFADAAVSAVADLPIAITVLDAQELAEGDYGGIVGVGQGSSRPPRLVRLDYSPDDATSHLALVGKGITFDSGGLDLKPVEGMETMKLDLAGAATALQATIAIARLGLPLRVTGWLALAENLPSGTSQRPGDVITMRDGRTVAVDNTDAEGRLVLADALTAAGEEEPDRIVDIATLTGAQMVALGMRVSGLMSNDVELSTAISELGTACGEPCWPMPLPADLRRGLDSTVADLSNMGERWGGMLTAGIFLSEFVPTRSDGSPTPWAHLDVCGPAFNTQEPYGYIGRGGTGTPLRTLVALAERLAGSGR